MYEDLELLELEDFEDHEDWEDFEDLEDYEDWEDFEDYEGDPFLGGIVRSISRVARRVPWGQVIRTGADILSNMEEEAEALGEMSYMAELAAEAESDAEADMFLGAIANIAGSLLPALLGNKEAGDFEDYEDWEDYEDYEGDEFLGALIPVAASLLPKAIPWVKKGIRAVGRALREADPSGQAVKALPIIADKSVKSLARQAKVGKPLTKKRVQMTIARQTKKTLANPRKTVVAVKVNRKRAAKAVKKSRAKTKLSNQMMRRKRLLRAR